MVWIIHHSVERDTEGGGGGGVQRHWLLSVKYREEREMPRDPSLKSLLYASRFLLTLDPEFHTKNEKLGNAAFTEGFRVKTAGLIN